MYTKAHLFENSKFLLFHHLMSLLKNRPLGENQLILQDHYDLDKFVSLLVILNHTLLLLYHANKKLNNYLTSEILPYELLHDVIYRTVLIASFQDPRYEYLYHRMKLY